MSTDETKQTLWSAGHIIDEFSTSSGIWRFVLPILGVIFLVDAVISIALSQTPQQDPFDFSGSSELRQYLKRVSHEEKPWLLVGDSVLAGDVMADHVAEWRTNRVIDFMTAQRGTGEADSFHQVALNGLLPIDIHSIVMELDRVDPKGKVGLVIELNPRYFSRLYAGQVENTRPWLSDLGRPLLHSNGSPRWINLARFHSQQTGDLVLDHLPLSRLRHNLPAPNQMLGEAGLISKRGAAPRDEAGFEGRARVLEHYTGIVLDERSEQVSALLAVLQRLKAINRPALLFTTPLNDQFLRDTMSPEQYGDYLARVGSWVSRYAGARVRLRHLDHDLFTQAHFMDHCHLLPEGNRLLALNLLRGIDISLRERPSINELAYDLGVDGSLVWNGGRGYRNGASWQAQFNGATSLTLDGDARVIVADTLNHCLRAVDIKTGSVETIAGTPGAVGASNGAATAALLNEPTAVCVSGDSIYFTDNGGKFLRRLIEGRIEMIAADSGPSWSEIRAIRTYKDVLYLLDGAARILVFSPDQRRSRVLLQTRDSDSIRGFCLSPDGVLYVADQDSRIWTGVTPGELILGETGSGLKLLFPNSASTVSPEGRRYPHTFDEARFAAIDDMIYVERYKGLLVKDDVPVPSNDLNYPDWPHLRFLDLERQRVLPWVKPVVWGKYTINYQDTDAILSRFQQGAMAFDQDTATLFYVESDRSHLFYISDGLWGTAQINTLGDDEAIGGAEPLTRTAADWVLFNMRPDQFLRQRIQSAEMVGPYTLLMMGSSLTAVSDVVGPHSLLRRTAEELKDHFDTRRNVRLESMAKSFGGIRLKEAVEYFETIVTTGIGVDVLLMEIWGTDRPTRGEVFLQGLDGERGIRDYIARLQLAAEVFDTQLLFFDNSGLYSYEKEGPRPAPETTEKIIALLEQSGLPVIRLSHDQLRASLDVHPWGSPPYDHSHGSPQAVDATGVALASKAYPFMERHLRSRVPAIDREPAALRDPLLDSESLRGLCETEAIVRIADGLPRIDSERALQKALSDTNLNIFVDLTKVPQYKTGVTPLDLERIAAGAIIKAATSDIMGNLASSVSIRMATFTNFDEYGEGILESSTVHFDQRFSRAELETFLNGLG